MSKRELIEANLSDKRYVHRDDQRQFKGEADPADPLRRQSRATGPWRPADFSPGLQTTDEGVHIFAGMTAGI